MNAKLRTLLLAAGIAVAGQAAADVTFYSQEGFRGRTFTADDTVWNLGRTAFNDQASSAVVRGGSWEVCTDARFDGNCVVLRPGNYPSLAAIGLDNSISSARQVTHMGRRGERADVYAYDSRDRRYYRDDNRYQYRDDGWRYDRYENRWERY